MNVRFQLCLALLLSGCAPTECEGECVNAYLTFHVEGWDDLESEEYEAHVAGLDRTLRTLEWHGGKATLDLSEEFLDGLAAHGGESTLDAWSERGHDFGVHASAGAVTEPTELAGYFGDLRAKATDLDLDARHVSGACSAGDWPAAALEGGFTAVNGMTAYCLQSYEPEMVPEEYDSDYACQNPSECHYPFPQSDDALLHPWYSDSGEDWMEPATSGIQLFGVAGGLSCFRELGEGETSAQCPYDLDDNESVLTVLDDAIAKSDPSQLNKFGLTWSLGDIPDTDLFESLLVDLARRRDAGSLVWSTLPELMD